MTLWHRLYLITPHLAIHSCGELVLSTRRLLSMFVILLSFAQSVLASAACCELDQSGDSVHVEILPDSGADLPGDDGLQKHIDTCLDCSSCQCCAHFAPAPTEATTQFQPSYTRYINSAPTYVSLTRWPLLRPPRVLSPSASTRCNFPALTA